MFFSDLLKIGFCCDTIEGSGNIKNEDFNVFANYSILLCHLVAGLKNFFFER